MIKKAFCLVEGSYGLFQYLQSSRKAVNINFRVFGLTQPENQESNQILLFQQQAPSRPNH